MKPIIQVTMDCGSYFGLAGQVALDLQLSAIQAIAGFSQMDGMKFCINMLCQGARMNLPL